MFIRFKRVRERDGQTDEQTDGHRITSRGNYVQHLAPFSGATFPSLIVCICSTREIENDVFARLANIIK